MSWMLGAKIAGGLLNYAGQKKQQKAEQAAMQEAQAAQDKYNADMQAWNDQQAAAAHSRAMAEYNAARERELAVLKAQGATQDELIAHDQKLGEQFMAQMENFSGENAQAAIDENTAAANAEQDAALEGARAERGETSEHASDAFKQARSEAMADADAKADTFSKGLSGLTGVTRGRKGEDMAQMNIGVLGSSGARARRHIEDMGAMTQRRLGYHRPSAPSGPASTAGMPQEPNIEIPVSDKGNKLSMLGSLMGAGANAYSGWQNNKKMNSFFDKWS